MTRWKAAGIHLAISATIGALVLALLFWVWYPAPYFRASGGMDLTLILLSVDLVLGPLLTLVVFKSGKKSLRFDLGVIAALQIAALAYGVHVMAQARPVFVVGTKGVFIVTAANEIEAKDLAEGKKPEFQSLSWTGPRIVAAPLPDDTMERQDLMFSGAAGRDINVFPRYYIEYAADSTNMLAWAKPFDNLRTRHPQTAQPISDWMSKSGRTEADTRWLPARARDVGLTIVVDAQSGAVLDVLDIDPW